jgi:hypothetical protein
VVEGVERVAAVDLELEAVVRSLVENGCPTTNLHAKGDNPARGVLKAVRAFSNDGLFVGQSACGGVAGLAAEAR